MDVHILEPEYLTVTLPVKYALSLIILLSNGNMYLSLNCGCSNMNGAYGLAVTSISPELAGVY